MLKLLIKKKIKKLESHYESLSIEEKFVLIHLYELKYSLLVNDLRR